MINWERMHLEGCGSGLELVRMSRNPLSGVAFLPLGARVNSRFARRRHHRARGREASIPRTQFCPGSTYGGSSSPDTLRSLAAPQTIKLFPFRTAWRQWKLLIPTVNYVSGIRGAPFSREVSSHTHTSRFPYEGGGISRPGRVPDNEQRFPLLAVALLSLPCATTRSQRLLPRLQFHLRYELSNYHGEPGPRNDVTLL